VADGGRRTRFIEGESNKNRIVAVRGRKKARPRIARTADVYLCNNIIIEYYLSAAAPRRGVFFFSRKTM